MPTKDNSAILQPAGSLRKGVAYRFWFGKEYAYYRTCKSAVNEAIRLYHGYNVPTVEKVNVLIGKDKTGTFFILQPADKSIR